MKISNNYNYDGSDKEKALKSFFEQYFLAARNKYFEKVNGEENWNIRESRIFFEDFDFHHLLSALKSAFINKEDNEEIEKERIGYLNFGWFLKKSFLFRFPIPLQFSSLFCKILWNLNECNNGKWWDNILPNNLEYLGLKLKEISPKLEIEIDENFNRIINEIECNSDDLKSILMKNRIFNNIDLSEIEKIVENNSKENIFRSLLIEVYKMELLFGNNNHNMNDTYFDNNNNNNCDDRKRQRLEWIIQVFCFINFSF